MWKKLYFINEQTCPMMRAIVAQRTQVNEERKIERERYGTTPTNLKGKLDD